MKRRIYIKHENLLTVLSLKDNLNRDHMVRMVNCFEKLGVNFPLNWDKEKRHDFVMNFLVTATAEDCGTKLSLIVGKEMNNKEAMAVLYEIVEAAVPA